MRWTIRFLVVIFVLVVGSLCFHQLMFLSTTTRVQIGTGKAKEALPSNKTSNSNPSSDSYHFPTVNERVKLYMSSWYDPPCSEKDRIRVYFNGSAYLVKELRLIAARTLATYGFPSDPPHSVFYYNKSTCQESHDLYRGWIDYCSDSIVSIEKATEAIEYDSRIPIFFLFGDYQISDWLLQTDDAIVNNVHLPHLKKFRPALHRDELQTATSTCASRLNAPSLTPLPIIWPLNMERHFGMLPRVRKYDREWHRKKNKAIFRGGLRSLQVPSQRNMTDVEYCLRMSRCRLVYQCAHSRIIDAKTNNLQGIVPATIEGVNILGSLMHRKEMLSYKGIIVVEGNDVASGLKWALYSSSVVLMARPTCTSWAMEELLEPWVHYIPLQDDWSDVEEQVQWMLDHDEEAQNIAHRGYMWIYNLVFGLRSRQDDDQILREILWRYAAHFEVVNSSGQL